MNNPDDVQTGLGAWLETEAAETLPEAARARLVEAAQSPSALAGCYTAMEGLLAVEDTLDDAGRRVLQGAAERVRDARYAGQTERAAAIAVAIAAKLGAVPSLPAAAPAFTPPPVTEGAPEPG